MNPFEKWLRAAQAYCEAADTGSGDTRYRESLWTSMIWAFHEYRCSDDYRPPEIIQGPFEDKLDVTP